MKATPISRLARHHRLRARFEALEFARAAALAISAAEAGLPLSSELSADARSPGSLETLIETGRHDEAAAELDRLEPLWGERLARGILAAKTGTSPPARPGYLIINPLGVPRRVAVTLPDAALDLRPEGPLRAAQFTDMGVCAVVDAPAFGFAWVPREPNLEQPPTTPGDLSARGQTLKNETVQVEIDEATGGIRGVMAAGESTARLGQQLVITGLGESGGKPVISQMKADRFDVDYAGPALVQATSAGALVDPGTGAALARFTQRYRLWTGRPVLEIAITLSDIDPSWLRARGPGRPLEPLRGLSLGLARPDLDGQTDRASCCRDDRARPSRDSRRHRHLDPPPAHGLALRRPSLPPEARRPDARHAARGRRRDRAVVPVGPGPRPRPSVPGGARHGHAGAGRPHRAGPSRDWASAGG